MAPTQDEMSDSGNNMVPTRLQSLILSLSWAHTTRVHSANDHHGQIAMMTTPFATSNVQTLGVCEHMC